MIPCLPSMSTIYVYHETRYTILYFLAAERRRREEGWNDLGLDQLDSNNPWSHSNGQNWNTATGNNQQQQQQNAGGSNNNGGNN